MKPGDLAYVKNTATGDTPQVVNLWRTKDPVLVLEIKDPLTPLHGSFAVNSPWVAVLHGGEEIHLRLSKLKKIET